VTRPTIHFFLPHQQLPSLRALSAHPWFILKLVEPLSHVRNPASWPELSPSKPGMAVPQTRQKAHPGLWHSRKYKKLGFLTLVINNTRTQPPRHCGRRRPPFPPRSPFPLALGPSEISEAFLDSRNPAPILLPPPGIGVTHSPKMVPSGVRRPRKSRKSGDSKPAQNNVRTPGVRLPGGAWGQTGNLGTDGPYPDAIRVQLVWPGQSTDG